MAISLLIILNNTYAQENIYRLLTFMLAAKNIRRLIDGVPIWSGLSFKLKPGDRLALRGPSGSGKTLLMRSLVGLDEIDGGEILYDGRSLDDWHLPDYRRRVRYIPQDASFITGTVKDSISLFFRFKANRDLQLDEYLLDSLTAQLQLPANFLEKTADRLSGGEKQIVALIRSLMLQPEVLLLDEPTSNLDESMVSNAEQLIEHWIRQDSSRSLIWTSHDTRQLDRMTNRNLHISNYG